MSRIRILSEHIANQIAAGEVVERPASVVKELLENSLDAGATRIAVQIEGGGTRLVRVMDNGAGMDEDDVLLSIERHATSKLRDESQLAAIATLGFRGEALPSIGSVARLTILSRPWDRETGTRAEIRYGRLHAVHEDGCARGTIVEIRSLFGNVPARKKFLKSARTELYHIEEVIRNQALASVDAAFSLRVDSRSVIDLPAGGGVEQRVRDVFRCQDPLLPVDFAAGDEKNGLRLSGYLLQPETSSSRTNRLRILVNGRPVRDRMIRHGVVEGLQGFLMKGQSPAGALFLQLAPAEVDVNVHPAKLEIRFRSSQEVHRFVVQAVAAAIKAYQEEVRSDIFSIPAPFPEQTAAPLFTAEARCPLPASSPPEAGSGPGEPARMPGNMAIRRSAEPAASFRHDPEPFSVVKPPDSLADFTGLTLIGQFAKLYLLCEKDDRLIVIDQHAAHERIMYQRLRRDYLRRDIPGQNLMFPVSVELDPRQLETLKRYDADVALLGFAVEDFGESTRVIKAVPALVSHLDPAEMLAEILASLCSAPRDEPAAVVPPRIDHLLASMACKAAVKAGNRLAPAEMFELLRQMKDSELFSHCPHGRPVVKIFSKQDIEKWFHRL
ncbi:DNA mismatch repair protein MutL [hydrothermal vent metagenome]|uniref:DNA mismatch repair protein MutL n=1 Tax=hydrothermal vent metagenome TaxID=652676 RepID=A0A3B0V6V0_9ZZZZ